MSSVTSVFVVVGDGRDGLAEEVAPKVAEAIAAFIAELAGRVPVISIELDGWPQLQGGIKGAGGAVIWFGWNYGQPEKLEAHLQALDFEHITVWSQQELNGSTPRVTSW